MKKYLIMLLATVMAVAACNKEPKQVKTYDLAIRTELGGDDFQKAGLTIILIDANTGVSFEEQTDETGTATFKVPAGVYTANVQYKEKTEGSAYKYTIYNGVNSSVVVAAGEQNQAVLQLVTSQASAIVIKEFYGTGCSYTATDGSTKPYYHDRYVILYNNTAESVTLNNFGLAMLSPYNAHQDSKFKGADGVLSYENADWIPVGVGVWSYNSAYTIPAYSEVTIAITGAIDHTATYSTSVDLSNVDFVCYNPETSWNNTSYYPEPNAGIPSSHYLKASIFSGATANAWPLSNTSPAFVLFQAEGREIAEWAADVTLNDDTQTAIVSHHMPKSWVIDAIELYSTPKLDKSGKRLTADLDAGYVKILNNKGYSVYRNVDEDATVILEENEGKLVYNYSGTIGEENGSTDPSNIDAEASIKNGAHIIYLDTNNSSKDLHQRAKATLAK